MRKDYNIYTLINQIQGYVSSLIHKHGIGTPRYERIIEILEHSRELTLADIIELQELVGERIIGTVPEIENEITRDPERAKILYDIAKDKARKKEQP